jgi:hypothetical protein
VARLIEFEKTPVLSKWIQRQVDKGEDARALQIVQDLNAENESPWSGKIRMANDDDGAGDATINQKSFVTSLKKGDRAPQRRHWRQAGDALSTGRACCARRAADRSRTLTAAQGDAFLGLYTHRAPRRIF